MLSLYNSTSEEISTLITKRYSTSFSIGIKTLQKDLRNPIYAIYGFVRLADEIVDTFFDVNQEEILGEFIASTWQAIDRKLSVNPVLHSFQLAVHKFGISEDLITAFLDSMQMDLVPQKYASDLYHRYIYGSAEVVGLMCLQVFCNGDTALYDKLKDPAKSLGAAFQKVNFLRDIKSDYVDRGRTYFPGIEIKQFSDSEKALIEIDIAKDFDDALEGILLLPPSAKGGVLLAYKYYLQLFKKIKQLPASKILESRIRVPNNYKLLLFLQTYTQTKLNII